MSCPARAAIGPLCPQPVMRPTTSFGLRAKRISGPSPSRSRTPGRKPSSRTSARAASCSIAAVPFAHLRSSVTERRPRNIRSYFRSRATPSCGSKRRSTSRTSAPMSASTIPQNGTGPMDSSSSTLTPASGPADALTPPRLAPLLGCSAGTRRFAWRVPVLQQREPDREQRRPQEQTDETERNDAPEDTEQDEDERQVAAAADDQRLD